MIKKQTNNIILVCGSLVYDRIMNFPGKFSDHILPDKVHILNVSFTLDKLHESFGGTGGNIAYNLALLGERPKLLAVAGLDFKKYGAWLKQNKVDISNVKISNTEVTASCYIMTDQADNQITGFYPGPPHPTPLPLLTSVGEGAEYGEAGKGPLPRGTQRPPAGQAGGRGGVRERGGSIAIVSPDLVARMREYVKMFKQLKVPYIFDPGQQITSLTARELKWAAQGAKVLIGNDYEIELILDKIGTSLARLKNWVEILVITKGAKGSEIYAGPSVALRAGKKIIIPAARPKAILDPTGAGDGYRAGLLKGLVENWSLEKCGRLASVVAVYTVEKYGTQTHRFSWQELEKRYRENYHENL